MEKTNKIKISYIHIIYNKEEFNEFYLRVNADTPHEHGIFIYYDYLYIKNGLTLTKRIGFNVNNICLFAEIDKDVIKPELLKQLLEFGYVNITLGDSGRRTQHSEHSQVSRLTTPPPTSITETGKQLTPQEAVDELPINFEEAQQMLADFRARAAQVLGG